MPGRMNRKVFFVVLSLLLVISVAGCTENVKQLEKIGSGIVSGVSGPSLQDVATAPQKYVGKEVTLTGKLETTLGGGVFLEGENGYTIYLYMRGSAVGAEWVLPNRRFLSGRTYTFTGKTEYLPEKHAFVFFGKPIPKRWYLVVGGG